MFIVYGLRNVEKTIDSGTFLCPHCNARRDYDLKAYKRYAHIFAIPIIPLPEEGEFVACRTCRKQFQKAVLYYDPAKQIKRQKSELNWTLYHLMVQMMKIDNEIKDKELNTIGDVYLRLTGDELESEDIKLAADAQMDINFVEYLGNYVDLITDKGKNMVLASLFLIANSDDRLSDKELALFFEVGNKLGRSKSQLQSSLVALIDLKPESP